MKSNTDEKELIARLKAFGLIVKLGGDLFDAVDFGSAAAIAVNSSRTLLRFDSSAMLECRGSECRVVAQFGQTALNEENELAALQRRIGHELVLEPGVPKVFQPGADSGLSPEGGGALEEWVGPDGRLLAVELVPPAFLGVSGCRLIWLMSFPGEVPPYAVYAASIMTKSVGEALYCHRFGRKSTGMIFRRKGRLFLWLMLIPLFGLAMLIPVRESVNAEFVLKAPEIVSGYAPFDGPIARCFKQDGERVEKGEKIAEYDTSQVKFRWLSAKNRMQETEKEYELENAAAFSDRARLGKVQLLATRLDGAAIDVREAQWYLDHAAVTAPESGVLALADGRAELLTNKVVRTGDRIFDIYGGKGVVAEIQVNEQNSSILLDQLDITLFLYTQPDRAIRGKVNHVRQYPELTEQRVWCYKVTADLEDDIPLRYGMRGVAKLRGGRVTLGYDLFKSLVLYLRRL